MTAGLPIATLTFTGLLLLCTAAQVFAGAALDFAVPTGLAFVPGSLFGGAEPGNGPLLVAPPATLVTYQFLHVGWLHLAGNLGFLWIFGPNLESTLGPGRWTALLVLTGVAAGLAQAWPDPSSAAPVVGASGSIAGLAGAYLYFHPRDEFHPVWPRARPLRVPVWLVLAAWLILQLIAIYGFETVPGAAAFRAHVGGFACGLLLAPVLHFIALSSQDAPPVARTRTSRDSSH